MIDKNVVKKLVEEWLQDKEYFLVSVEISPDNRIVVEIDHADGVWIEDCAKLSQYIEDHLNRDEEDYELEVGSAGVTAPFSVPEQYRMNVGNPVDILTRDGQRLHATLAAVSDDASVITVTLPTKVREEGAKRPKIVDVPRDIPVADIKSIVREIVF